MRIIAALTLILSPSISFACGQFGNSGDGCAENVAGVQTEAGTVIEITTIGANWSSGHVCEGSNVIRFGGTDLEKKSALSIAMASYMSNKGPIYFRCNKKLAYGVCDCTNIVLGNSWRD